MSSPSSVSSSAGTINVATVSALLDPSLKPVIANIPSYANSTVYAAWNALKPAPSDWNVAKKALHDWAIKQLVTRGMFDQKELEARANQLSENILKVMIHGFKDPTLEEEFQKCPIPMLVERAASNELTKEGVVRLAAPCKIEMMAEINHALESISKDFQEIDKIKNQYAFAKKKEMFEIGSKMEKTPAQSQADENVEKLEKEYESLKTVTESLKSMAQDAPAAAKGFLSSLRVQYTEVIDLKKKVNTAKGQAVSLYPFELKKVGDEERKTPEKK